MPSATVDVVLPRVVIIIEEVMVEEGGDEREGADLTVKNQVVATWNPYILILRH
jgi:hypothetical protein